MALQPCHRYLIQRLNEGLCIYDEAVTEQLVRRPSVLGSINGFFGKGGASKIFIGLSQKASAEDEDGELFSISDAPEEGSTPREAVVDPSLAKLVVSNGDDGELCGRVVYFLKVRAKPDETTPAIDASRYNDNQLMFGVLDDPLHSLEAMFRALYKPMLQAQATGAWGHASEERRNDFTVRLQQVMKGLQDALENLSGRLVFQKPHSAFEELGIEAANNIEAVLHYIDLLREWCDSVHAYLGKSDRGRWESTDSGPHSEIEYWKRRMQRLVNIVEQLRSRQARHVISVLTTVTRQPEDRLVDYHGVLSLIRQWHQIDVSISEATTEAKDNVKYLSTLERFIKPLFSGDPDAIRETIPALMNALKMMYGIARYYGTKQRMTKLFMKITNEMIRSCKLAINGEDPPAAIWDRDMPKLLKALESCLLLNETYQEQYHATQDKLLMTPMEKQFDFSETQIFGKFDLFCRRVFKLLDLFSTVHQFSILESHGLEGIEPLLKMFSSIALHLKQREHDLLDFNNNRFDRDYVDFTMRVEELEGSLQAFINQSFESLVSIDQSLSLLHKYQSILFRESLRADLDSKRGLIFQNYGYELSAVQETYDRYKHSPPAPRNIPPVSGSILWARQLLRRIEEPMQKFIGNDAVFQAKESRKIIRDYNNVARTLVTFEKLWHEAWCRSVETAKAGLQATLIIRHPETGELFVNFDPEIMQLIREAKCLLRLGVAIPEDVRLIMLQEKRFKEYFDRLREHLSEHSRVTSKIAPITSKLLSPILQTLELSLRPGMVTLTWTSMNIDAYSNHVEEALLRLEGLVTKINDIVENRIEKNLKSLSKSILVDLSEEHTMTLDDFVRTQEEVARREAGLMAAKNIQIKTAVTDLIALVRSFPLDPTVGDLSVAEIERLFNHYHRLAYQALLNATKASLNMIKHRVYARGRGGILFLQRPFFVVDVQLSVPSVRLSPSLDDVQRAINRVATAVLGCSKKMMQWECKEKTFFEWLGQDVEVIKVVLLLTGTLFGTRAQAHRYLLGFRKYDWLWKEDKEMEYAAFAGKNPSIAEYEGELKRFLNVESEIERISPVHNIGALMLNTSNLKMQLRAESRSWKITYSNHVHTQAKTAMLALFEYMRLTSMRLSREVDSIDSLRFLMAVLKEIRERDSSIEMEFTPICDTYTMLHRYLPGGMVDKEEVDQLSIMRATWRKLEDQAEEVADKLWAIQDVYKRKLVSDARDLSADVRQFRADYDESGPTAPGIEPLEAVTRLRRFKEELAILERKAEAYAAGEELFALKKTQYAELVRTKKDVALLDQLYTLYLDVEGAIESFRGIRWVDLTSQFDAIAKKLDNLEFRCSNLPRRLRERNAYQALQDNIRKFQEVLPLLKELSKTSIKARHWEEVVNVTRVPFPYDREAFYLSDILDSPILVFKDNVAEICEGADEQLQIELKLREWSETWARRAFTFGSWKDRGECILADYGDVIDELEDGEQQLRTLLSMKHVFPFREAAQTKLVELSFAADTLELWVKVQMLWTSLESVFLGGDIAKQMPVEAKKFSKIDKEWLKIMARATDQKYVVPVCSNELLKTTLPVLFAELEKCQKSLDSYLEQKRRIFPRFYFVSNSVLLLVLSKGSDPLQMQPYYAKIFDSVSRVVHDRADKHKIVALRHIQLSDEEIIQLRTPVEEVGNIEDWLGKVEEEMKATVKDLTSKTSANCAALPLRELVESSSAQMALLGIQLIWTAQCQEALEQCRTSKSIMNETGKAQLAILNELSAWCLEDLGSKMKRQKIETLITIQVHQRDTFQEILARYKERKLHDPSDFEWTKQCRFYWQTRDKGHLVVQICDFEFNYANEYLGNKERLVITPLTDRCYVTLSQALGMHLGGAPIGPAGTGKTETVKDMGRRIGTFVLVVNCSDQQRHSDVAKTFKGLCQAGLWCCFDEFNRIQLRVLSVVAQQVTAITTAKRSGTGILLFPGEDFPMRLKQSVAYFITMNPSYSGRQELPENLKALFRSVTMMLPDREIIIKVKLCSMGYKDFAEHARKFSILYSLCEQQLSKQRHYDFGLRNILTVLRSAGKVKRDNTTTAEPVLIMQILRDTNLSKLVPQDVPIFLSLIKDLFPDVEADGATTTTWDLASCLRDVLSNLRLIEHPSWCAKVQQLHETLLVRSGVILMGPAGGGKTTVAAVLQDCLTNSTGVAHRQVRLNPKAIREEQMFGETDPASGEWLNGVFSAIWAKHNDRCRKDVTWIVCDGPIDPGWIENLNTVLDDNKILTLANGDRLPMTNNVRLVFEVEDVKNASPATVSRLGVVFVSKTVLDWAPKVRAWLRDLPKVHREILTSLFQRIAGLDENYVSPLFSFVEKKCTAFTSITRLVRGELFAKFLQQLLQLADLSESADDLKDELERLFLYGVAYCVGGALMEDSRQQFDEFLRSLSDLMPMKYEATDTVYDYYVDLETMEWMHWKGSDATLPQILTTTNLSSFWVPTEASDQIHRLCNITRGTGRPVMIIGERGCGKTTTARQFMNALRESSNDVVTKSIMFSANSTPQGFQQNIEVELEKRGGKSFGPIDDRSMVCFLDDISMPCRNKWGDQPTLELVRQLLDTHGFCFLDKDRRGDTKSIEDIYFIAAMDGRTEFTNRLKRYFFLVYATVPTLKAISQIYANVLESRFGASELPEKVLEMILSLPKATVQLCNRARNQLRPTPTKLHYEFNLHDMSRIFQGITRAPESSIRTPQGCLDLWVHESQRVIEDKLTNASDKELFQAELRKIATKDVLKIEPQPKSRSVSPPGRSRGARAKSVEAAPTIPSTSERVRLGTLWADFGGDDDVYEMVEDVVALQVRLDLKVSEYNESGHRLELVFFDDAVRHLLCLVRCLGLSESHLLCVGVGGSGKQSLTRLAAFICKHEVFHLALSKTYNMHAFLEDLRSLYRKTGLENRTVTLLLRDVDITDEAFMEVLNTLLSTADVPDLFAKDELKMLMMELRDVPKDQSDGPDSLIPYFYRRVRANLHTVLCMSPATPEFFQRCRSYPNIIKLCQVNWFLAWPTEALRCVASRCLESMTLHYDGEMSGVEVALETHMAAVHSSVVCACDTYLQKTRRSVYHTPTAFIAFLRDYKRVYNVEVAKIDAKANSVQMGLSKLQKAAEDVETMKLRLAESEVKLRSAEEAANAMLGRLEMSSMEAKREDEAVAKIKQTCEADARQLAGETAAAEADLAEARPFVEEAEEALDKIRPSDLNELKKLQKPSDIIRLIFDCVAVLLMLPMPKVEVAEVTLGIGKEKQTVAFLKDNYAAMKSGLLADARFLQQIMAFSRNKRDVINDETIELLRPYLELRGFSPPVARNASKAAEGLCIWVRAMTMYQEASKIVKPKLDVLKIAEGRLQEAQLELSKAEAKLQRCQEALANLQEDFERSMTTKRQIEDHAKKTKSRIEQAAALLDSLSSERKRWFDDTHKFANRKHRLLGDVVVATAFLNYAGPFNQETRKRLVSQSFSQGLKDLNIPYTPDLDVTDFLVDVATIGRWRQEGLPSTASSVQNGVIASRASRFPLLIDPQGQALKWIIAHEAGRLPAFGATTPAKHPKLPSRLEHCLGEGLSLVVVGVDKALDPLLTPILEKHYCARGRTTYVTVSDKLCEVVETFRLYLITRASNPWLTPEEQARTTIVDFSLTHSGLEEQLLGRVVQKEQRSMEDQLSAVLEEVTDLTQALVDLDKLLLGRLSTSEGNLLEDDDLIQVLSETKTNVTDVKHKLAVARETRESIKEKREQFRPVATRGSVLYFAVVEMSAVNWMYQTSFDKFQELFDDSIDRAEKGFVNKRLNSILEELTFTVYRYVNQGLYKRDKLPFKLLLALKIYLGAGRLTADDVAVFLNGGNTLDAAAAALKPNPFSWLPKDAWLNVLGLAERIAPFRSLPDDMASASSDWLAWWSSEQPEARAAPNYDARLGTEAVGAFYRALLVRCLRHDRTVPAALKFLRHTDLVEVEGGQTLAAMGSKYVETLSDSVETVCERMTSKTPLMYLLSPGADPTENIENLCRKKRKVIQVVGLGEGQDVVAANAIAVARACGTWVLLQNCHLDLAFMETMEGIVDRMSADGTHVDFRLFLTTKPHPQFSASLLQSCMKLTNEAPRGLRAGMLRSFSGIIDQDLLDRIESPTWKRLVYALGYLHSIVQERRKFGVLGWCVPYEFNDGDLQACLAFLERHLFSGVVSWRMLQYMVAEVQYGGKVTDSFDQRLLTTYVEQWFTPAIMKDDFRFSPGMSPTTSEDDACDIPTSGEIEDYHKLITTMPELDSPEVFGLHPNADLSVRAAEASHLLSSLSVTQPRTLSCETSGIRESAVLAKVDSLRETCPELLTEATILSAIESQGGLNVPLNVFLYQELQLLLMLLDSVEKSLRHVVAALKGEIVGTSDLHDCIGVLDNAQVPQTWLRLSGGEDHSPQTPTLNLWWAEVRKRNQQLRDWMTRGRPASFWMTGFFNAQGFLTAVQQEIARGHSRHNNSLSLDSLRLFTEVTEFETPEKIKAAPKEGVFVHGLFLESAEWNAAQGGLVEAKPKTPFSAFPVLYVTAVGKGSSRLVNADYGPHGPLVAPVYRVPTRTDANLIFTVKLMTRNHSPAHWILRGVALVCNAQWEVSAGQGSSSGATKASG